MECEILVRGAATLLAREVFEVRLAARQFGHATTLTAMHNTAREIAAR